VLCLECVEWLLGNTSYGLSVQNGTPSAGTPIVLYWLRKILLPAQYQIYVYQDDNGDPVEDIPAYAQRVESSGSNLWAKYWIANSTNWDLAPGQQALQDDLWDNGVSQ
jgi:hypothetical protein